MSQMSIAMLKAERGQVYLATPYSRYHAGIDKAAKMAAKAAAALMKMGVRVFSPIAHSHAISLVGEIDPKDWAFWKPQNEAAIDAASALAVIKVRGWDTSVGVAYEIKRFSDAGKQVVYIEPGEVGL
ncbi:MAG: DUF1937 family protein [Devosia sp.]|uniref:DUF1937 family protein n=1 Tax=Devosia sp. TaxID=1871048 RepID=UPI001A4B74EF|nr:DUF1937 family protein [Devosia sp.]MBL8599239.1 DUF1937 family protein [Devosia sp.]